MLFYMRRNGISAFTWEGGNMGNYGGIIYMWIENTVLAKTLCSKNIQSSKKIVLGYSKTLKNLKILNQFSSNCF